MRFSSIDFYHQQRMDGELLATYRRLKDRIVHIQIADNPGRHEPGTGEINYPFLFEALDREATRAGSAASTNRRPRPRPGLAGLRNTCARLLARTEHEEQW